MTIPNELLRKTIVMVRLIDLILVEIVWNILKGCSNCLNQGNQKLKNCLNLEIWLNKEKNG